MVLLERLQMIAWSDGTAEGGGGDDGVGKGEVVVGLLGGEEGESGGW